ncbi:hypothetical protein GN956_G24713 [Arapaima gigas]
MEPIVTGGGMQMYETLLRSGVKRLPQMRFDERVECGKGAPQLGRQEGEQRIDFVPPGPARSFSCSLPGSSREIWPEAA